MNLRLGGAQCMRLRLGGCPVHVSEVRGCPVHASEIRGAYTFLFQATTITQQERKQGKGTGQTKSPMPQFVRHTSSAMY